MSEMPLYCSLLAKLSLEDTQSARDPGEHAEPMIWAQFAFSVQNLFMQEWDKEKSSTIHAISFS